MQLDEILLVVASAVRDEVFVLRLDELLDRREWFRLARSGTQGQA